jgi:dTDP-4-dehydrorhamnose reductase
VYFSSDYIFDGRKGPYVERDLANPINVYGRHKLAAEHYVLKWAYGFLIVRTTVVYSWERKSCVARWIKSLRNDTPISVPIDQIGTPTYAPNLAEIVVELAEARAKGVVHITGPDLLSRYDFALEVARTFELDETLVWGLESQALHQKAARPLKAGMGSTELCVTDKEKLVGVRKGLELMRQHAA